MTKNPLKIVGQNLSDRDFRDAFGHFPSGVVALCSMEEGKPIGMVASSFTSVSINPPFLSVCIGNESHTWKRLAQSGHIGISVLSADQEQVCAQLTADPADRFVNLDLNVTDAQAILINGAAAWFECDLTDVFPAGDHFIALLAIKAMCEFPEAEPLIFHRSNFHTLKI